MGYRNRTKEPYEKLNELWSSFKENIKELSSFLDLVYYDGVNKNCFATPAELAKYPKYHIERESEVGRKLFILPCEYPMTELDGVLITTTPPSLPQPNSKPDKLVLEEFEYPDWYKKYIDRDKTERELLIGDMNLVSERISEKFKSYESLYQETLDNALKIKLGIENLNSNANEKLIKLAHLKHHLPVFLRAPIDVSINTQSRLAIVQFKFPDYQPEDIVVGYMKTGWGVPKLATEAAKKKLIKQTLYSLIIRLGYISAKFNPCDLFDSVVINVEQDWFDPATGQPRSGVIASLQAPVAYLQSLDLSKLDPEACFKYLKGISTPNLQNISPIRPIFTLNKDDERLVESKDVDSYIEPESNLAAMEWEDFEHLVAQLFEWEFSQNGIEVKVTRASRDRGVDAILFDPDPLKGGKYVIQAKRYTRTVDVSAVRDLYGTVMNEGANRGILITTASYGPDAYEFAKNKQISLVDGPNLLLMLQKHGKKFKIDLEEARRLNNEN